MHFLTKKGNTQQLEFPFEPTTASLRKYTQLKKVTSPLPQLSSRGRLYVPSPQCGRTLWVLQLTDTRVTLHRSVSPTSSPTAVTLGIFGCHGRSPTTLAERSPDEALTLRGKRGTTKPGLLTIHTGEHCHFAPSRSDQRPDIFQ